MDKSVVTVILLFALLIAGCAPAAATPLPQKIKIELTLMEGKQSIPILMDEYKLAQIDVPPGTVIEIAEADGVTISPSGFAVSKMATTKTGVFAIRVVECPGECPVVVNIIVTK